MNNKQTWEQFSRRTHYKNFYACIDAHGNWFDTSEFFDNAVHWCACRAGFQFLSPAQEIEWMSTEGMARGYSVVHHTLLRKMFDAGMMVKAEAKEAA